MNRNAEYAEHAEGHGVKQANGESRRRAAARPATGLRELTSISEAIIGAAIEVHKALGPGLLESTYEACLDWSTACAEWSTALTPMLDSVFSVPSVVRKECPTLR